MASRKQEKEQARARRVAQERDLAQKARRQQRLRTLAGLAVCVAAIMADVAVVASGGSSAPKPNSPAARRASIAVDRLLAGIPQHGNTLGSPSAKVTVTEFGDLECSVCDEFATAPNYTNPEGESGTGFEDDLINNYVRTGKVKLLYRSLETASSGNPNPNAFQLQQAAANATGLQNKEWYYVELFYNEQGTEGTGYVTGSYLQRLARQVPGLNFAKWMADRNLASVKTQVASDVVAGDAVDGGAQNASTPTIIIQGPKGRASPIVGLPSSYSQLESEINHVL